jgi:hypothetical protein
MICCVTKANLFGRRDQTPRLRHVKYKGHAITSHCVTFTLARSPKNKEALSSNDSDCIGDAVDGSRTEEWAQSRDVRSSAAIRSAAKQAGEGRQQRYKVPVGSGKAIHSSNLKHGDRVEHRKTLGSSGAPEETNQ